MASVFGWDASSELAAQLIADGDLTQEAIAVRVGVARMTLYTWRKHPDFAARVEQNLAEIRSEIRRIGIADRENRIRELDDRHRKLKRVIEDRASDPRIAGVPGGLTGLIVHDVKGIGRGDDFRLVDLYEVDTGTLAEMRAIEMQAAKEMGQWSEKSEQRTEGKITVEYVGDAVGPIAEAASGSAAGLEGSSSIQRALDGPSLG